MVERRRYTMIAGITLVVVAGAFLFSCRESLLQAAGDYLVIQDNLHAADVIAVVSGPDDRTDYAIDLYQRGLGARLFFTGGWCDTIQGLHGERGKARALAQGVPEAAIAVDDTEVTSTYAEAVRLNAYIDALPTWVQSVIIVSDPYHMRRARWTYQRVLPQETNVQMAPVPFGLSPYQRQWWRDAASTQFVKDEYLKMVYYLARYQFSTGQIQEWLASLDQS